MAGYQQVAHHLRVVLLQHFADGEEVAQRLGHLLAVHAHRAGVHPGGGVELAGGRLALRDLVLVVREHQIRAAAVDVEGFAQAAGRHHRALDVPARPAGAPRRCPARLARLGAFPEDEIQRVLFGLVDLDARTDAQVLDLLARQLAVADEFADPVVDVAVARRVGEILVDQGLDHRVHPGDVAGGAGFLIRPQHGEARLVLMHRGDHALGQRLEGFTVLLRAADDLVVDVGDVAHVVQLVAGMAQPAGDHVERHHHPRVADVAEVVDGHPADVHAHLVAQQRLERFLGLAQGVVDRKHGSCPEKNGPLRVARFDDIVTLKSQFTISRARASQGGDT